MSTQPRIRRPSPSMAVSLLALSVALGGTSYAAIKLPANSVGTKQIKRAAITGEKVKDLSLSADDFAEGELPEGATGARGADGPAGQAGARGADGPAGQAGAKGADGPAGPAGPKGADGPAGPAGPKGADGPAGPAGPKGADGPAGAKGADGPAGPAGPVGATGATGATGPQGEPGTARAYVAVDPAGAVVASRSKGVTQANVSRDKLGTYCIRDLPFVPRSAMAVSEGWDTTIHVAYGDIPNLCGSGEQLLITIRKPVANAWSDAPFNLLLND